VSSVRVTIRPQPYEPKPEEGEEGKPEHKAKTKTRVVSQHPQECQTYTERRLSSGEIA
jgi:hypothetical protein